MSAEYSIKDYLIGYSKLVLDGHVVACQKHIWACMRFLKDIERENTPEFPYVFDEDSAMHFIEWCQEFKHTKGVLEGEYIELAPIQLFVFGNVYGWYKVYKSGRRKRRFTKVYWQVARKNAKSQSLACVASYEWAAYGVNMSEVYIGATESKQSQIVWKEVKAQIGACELLEDKYSIAYGEIRHERSDSVIVALSKESKKSGDGFNPQCGIIDEYHAHPTSEILDVITSGQGARVNPITFIITTAGFNLNHPCYRVEYDLVGKLLDPNNPIGEKLEHYFAMVNELDKDDDYNDRSVWEKANPIICSYEEGREKLEEYYEEAHSAPEKMRNFLTKNMNIWVSMADNGYIDTAKWKNCYILNPVIPDLTNRVGYIGIDLSQRHDLTSCTFEFPLDNGFYAIKHHSFLPEDRLHEKMNTDNVPYDLWVNQGYITLTEGETVDYRYIKEHIKREIAANKYNAKELCFDPWSALQFAQEMETEGYTPIEVIQGMKTLSEPSKDFRNKVLEGKIYHGDDPVLAWAIGNAVVKMDANANIQLDKAKSTNRIDPLAATINAHVRAWNHHLNYQDLSAHFLNGWRL
jgi:phage terminase large subunit-like protein